jgi:hypothetical protein
MAPINTPPNPSCFRLEAPPAEADGVGEVAEVTDIEGDVAVVAAMPRVVIRAVVSSGVVVTTATPEVEEISSVVLPLSDAFEVLINVGVECEVCVAVAQMVVAGTLISVVVELRAASGRRRVGLPLGSGRQKLPNIEQTASPAV